MKYNKILTHYFVAVKYYPFCYNTPAMSKRQIIFKLTDIILFSLLFKEQTGISTLEKPPVLSLSRHKSIPGSFF